VFEVVDRDGRSLLEIRRFGTTLDIIPERTEIEVG
jgi:hypothetical protein